MKQLKLTRWTEDGAVTRESWKDLISSLALAGYEIYADEEQIVFTLGEEDTIIEGNPCLEN